MSSSKIAFAGFMGAILMSVGAAGAVTTSIATQGYVDQEVGRVQSSTDALNTSIDTLGDTYEVLENKVTSIDENLTATQKDMFYPSVGAVLNKLSTVGLTESQQQAIENLTGDGGVLTRLENAEKALSGDGESDGVVSRLDTAEAAIETLNGTGADSVAGKISAAIETYSDAADEKYQAQSNADYSFGNADGGWTALTDKEQAALASGITAEKVAAYDAIAVDGSAIADIQTTVSELDDAINDTENGLKKIVAEQATEIADNADAIALNAQNIAEKITMPGECASGNSTCVLMISNGAISWTPVTDPVGD